jgi:HK97 family phage prohead protease
MEFITRAFAIDDMAFRSGSVTCERCGQNATGRMVDAYAAVFNVPTPISDQFGKYTEDIDPTAFNRTIGNGYRSVGVHFHHGLTLHGTPAADGAYPLGHPSTIRADQRGLMTSTHYSSSDQGDRALTLVKEGTVIGQSFSGRVIRSDKATPRGGFRPASDGTLVAVKRLELGLREYGPTPYPAYSEAAILATRAALGLPAPAQHSGDGPAGGTPPHLDGGPGTEDPHRTVHSGRSQDIARQRDLRNWLMLTEMEMATRGTQGQAE